MHKPTYIMSKRSINIFVVKPSFALIFSLYWYDADKEAVLDWMIGLENLVEIFGIFIQLLYDLNWEYFGNVGIFERVLSVSDRQLVVR